MTTAFKQDAARGAGTTLLPGVAQTGLMATFELQVSATAICAKRCCWPEQSDKAMQVGAHLQKLLEVVLHGRHISQGIAAHQQVVCGCCIIAKLQSMLQGFGGILHPLLAVSISYDLMTL